MQRECIVGVEQEPRVQFKFICDTDNIPDVINLPDGSMVVLHGKYASKGNNYSYRRVANVMSFNGEVKPWVKYTGLTG